MAIRARAASGRRLLLMCSPAGGDFVDISSAPRAHRERVTAGARLGRRPFAGCQRRRAATKRTCAPWVAEATSCWAASPAAARIADVSLPCPWPSTTPTAVCRRPPAVTWAKNARHPPGRGVRPGLPGVAFGDQGVAAGECAGDRQPHAGHRDDLTKHGEAHRPLEDAQLVRGSGDRARIEPARIGAGRVVHPEHAGLGVHLGNEAGLAAGDRDRVLVRARRRPAAAEHQRPPAPAAAT